MTLPIDRTTKSALDTNLVNGITSDAPKIKNSNDVVYNTIDELNNKVDGLVAASVLNPYPPAQYNKFSNGNFDRWVSGSSFTNPTTGSYTANRWKVNWSSGGGTLPNVTHSRIGVNPGDIQAAFNFYRIATDGAGIGLSSAFYQVVQDIEHGTRDLCGAGKKVTVSFWARSSITGKKIGIDLIQKYGTGGVSPSASEIINGSNFTLSSTWQKFSFTFTTNTLSGKVFGTNADDSLLVEFWPVWGSSTQLRVGASASEGFGGAGNIDIAQIQINVGDQIIPFQPMSLNEETINGLRYHWRSWTDEVNSPVVGSISGYAINTTTLLVHVRFPVPMRITPTIIITNNNVVNQIRNSATGVVTAITSPSPNGLSNKGFALLGMNGLTQGQYYDFDLIADAEF